jgi:hypothetical protein
MQYIDDVVNALIRLWRGFPGRIAEGREVFHRLEEGVLIRFARSSGDRSRWSVFSK